MPTHCPACGTAAGPAEGGRQGHPLPQHAAPARRSCASGCSTWPAAAPSTSRRSAGRRAIALLEAEVDRRRGRPVRPGPTPDGDTTAACRLATVSLYTRAAKKTDPPKAVATAGCCRPTAPSCSPTSTRPRPSRCGGSSWRCPSATSGPRRARALAGHFGTMDAIRRRRAEELAAVDGVGGRHRRLGRSSGSPSTGTARSWTSGRRRRADGRRGRRVHAAHPRGADRRGHRLARGVLPRRGQGGDPRPRRQGLRLGVEEDRLRRGRRERRLQGRQGRGARGAGAGRGRLPAPARGRRVPTEPMAATGPPPGAGPSSGGL